MIEIWKPINTNYPFYRGKYWLGIGIESATIKPIYEVSNTGKIRNINTGKLISVRNQGNVTLSVDIKYASGHIGLNRYGFSLARVIYSTYNDDLTAKDKVFFENRDNKDYRFNNLIKK